MVIAARTTKPSRSTASCLKGNMKTYILPITFYLEVEGENLPKELSPDIVKVLIDNLNISDETNDMFMDSIQERIAGDVVSFSFKP